MAYVVPPAEVRHQMQTRATRIRTAIRNLLTHRVNSTRVAATIIKQRADDTAPAARLSPSHWSRKALHFHMRAAAPATESEKRAYNTSLIDRLAHEDATSLVVEQQRMKTRHGRRRRQRPCTKRRQRS